jgi:hypothetical protein
MVVYGLSGLVEKWSIKCPWKIATRTTFSGQKKKTMNSNWTMRRLVAFFFLTVKKQLHDFKLGFFSKFNLVLQLLISFNLTPNWLQIFYLMEFCPYRISISTLNFIVLSIWSLVLDLCNLTINWPLNFKFSSISPLIFINYPLVQCFLQNGP